jgi:hypothetical protein
VILTLRLPGAMIDVLSPVISTNEAAVTELTVAVIWLYPRTTLSGFLLHIKLPSESETQYGIDEAIGSTIDSWPWLTEPELAIDPAPVMIMPILIELPARAGDAALLVTSVYTRTPELFEST